MAGEEVAAKRYAQAVFAIARDAGTFDQWLLDLDALAALIANPGAADFLARGKVSAADKEAFLTSTLAGLSPLAMNLARLLVRKDRTTLAPFIAQTFRAMADAERGIASAEVRTAVPLGDAEREAVAQRLSRLTGRRVAIEVRVDPALLGGMVARIGDTVIDGSVRGKLVALRRRLREATA